jgi:hypothetical protein
VRLLIGGGGWESNPPLGGTEPLVLKTREVTRSSFASSCSRTLRNASRWLNQDSIRIAIVNSLLTSAGNLESLSSAHIHLHCRLQGCTARGNIDSHSKSSRAGRSPLHECPREPVDSLEHHSLSVRWRAMIDIDMRTPFMRSALRRLGDGRLLEVIDLVRIRWAERRNLSLSCRSPRSRQR